MKLIDQKHYVARVRGPGERRFRVVYRSKKLEIDARHLAIWMSKGLRPYVLGQVLLCEPWYDPMPVLEMKKV